MVSFQHHLVAQDALVVKEKRITIIIAKTHGIEQAIGQLSRIRSAVLNLQLAGIAGGGLGHINRKGVGCSLLAGFRGKSHCIFHTGHKAYQQEFLQAAVTIRIRTLVVHCSGIIRDGFIFHMDSIGHPCGSIRAEIHV